MNSFAMSVLAVVAFRLKMDAKETSVVWLDRCTEQQTFRNQSARTHRVGVHFATEIHTVLAYTKAPMRIFGNARREAPLSSQPCIELNFGRWIRSIHREGPGGPCLTDAAQ